MRLYFVDWLLIQFVTQVTAIWNKEPKFPVMPRGKHRTALTRIENQSECSEKKSQKIPNVDEKQDVQGLFILLMFLRKME